MPPIILASQSPRRKDLLRKMELVFSVIPSNFEENLDHSRPVEEVAIELALGKAEDVAKDYPEAIVIGADTIVVIDGRQLGKPKDEAEARRTLELLAGRVNTVATGIAVIQKQSDAVLTVAVASKVYFKPFDREVMEAYIASGDWHDKAGSYSVQNGSQLIERIEGEYDAVLGLPTKALSELLRSLGVVSRPVRLIPPVSLTS